MKTTPQKAAPAKPISLRIDHATRVDVDYLVQCSGLKEAQVIRQAIRRCAEQARSAAGVAPNPARRSR
jgi:hypothetical protein